MDLALRLMTSLVFGFTQSTFRRPRNDFFVLGGGDFFLFKNAALPDYVSQVKKVNFED